MREGRYNLFVAQTPLQLLNAIEAQKKFGKSGEILLFYRQEYNRKRMQDLLKLYEVEQCSFFKITPLFRLTFIPLLFFRYWAKRGRVQSFFFGTYASWSAFLVNLLRPEECVLVDDGNKTVKILKDPDSAGVNNKRFLPVLSKAFLADASFFTYYSELAREYGREAVQNSLEHVTQVSGVSEFAALEEGDVIFIGTSILSGYEGIDDVLNRILDVAHGRRVLYVMHRYDQPEMLSGVRDRDNFEAVKFEYPLELVFGALWRENQPEVWTFGSTTIDTLSLIYPDLKVKVFELELHRFLSPKMRDLFRSLHEFYRMQPSVELVADY